MNVFLAIAMVLFVIYVVFCAFAEVEKMEMYKRICEEIEKTRRRS